MKRPIITIDIDGVIFDTPAWTASSYNEKYNASYTTADLFDQNARHNEAILVRDTDHYHDTQRRKELYVPADGCEEALELLSRNFELIALTARNYDAFSEVTNELMQLYVGDYIQNVVYTTMLNNDERRDKGELAQELRSSLHIDDSVEHCQSSRRAGIPAILFSQPYNQDLKYDPAWRAANWWAVTRIVADHFQVS